jgi:hypothetical protein
LSLWILDEAGETLVAESDSPIDKTENLWVTLQPDRDYLLKVRTNAATDFNRPYALAWRIEPSNTSNAQVPALPVTAALAAGFACAGIGAGRIGNGRI